MIRKTCKTSLMTQRGFSLVELLVVALIFSMITAAGSMLFVAGQQAWALVDTQIILQDQLRTTLQRLSYELQESGQDESAVLKVTIFDNTGVGGSDILRFSVPICPCGISPMDGDGDVYYWGAPLTWGQSGCFPEYTVQGNGKVAICHLPPGNPLNSQDLDVNVNAVKAHLAHGDYLGACSACTLGVYNNHYVEYMVDGNNRLIRRVLDAGFNVVGSDIFAEGVTGFQTVLNGSSTAVTVTLSLTKMTSNNRQVSLSNDTDVLLRNMN